MNDAPNVRALKYGESEQLAASLLSRSTHTHNTLRKGPFA